MIPIYICEDDVKQREKVTNCVRNYCMIENYDMDVALSTENPEKIIEKIKEQPQKSIFFFDIDLSHPIYNGLQLASEVRKYDPDGYIIFITTHAELTHLTFQFKVNALDFIIKDGTDAIEKRVRECLQVIHERMQVKTKSNEEQYFSYTTLDKTHYVPLSEILFFETGENHKIILYTETQRAEFTGSLTTIEKQVGEKFFRSHRGTLVQLDKISGIDAKNGKIMLINQQSCYLSVRKAGKLKKLLQT